MRNNPNDTNKVDNAFVLMIFCVFAASVFLVLMLGGSIYGNMIDVSAKGQSERDSISYIRAKIKSSDSAGSISINDFNGLQALVLSEIIEESEFVTYIYHYDGWVYELFHEKGLVFLPEDGRPIIKSDSLSFEVTDSGLIRISTDFGSLLISLRSTTRRFLIG